MKVQKFVTFGKKNLKIKILKIISNNKYDWTHVICNILHHNRTQKKLQ